MRCKETLLLTAPWPARRWELLTWRPPWSEVGGNLWQVRSIRGRRRGSGGLAGIWHMCMHCQLCLELSESSWLVPAQLAAGVIAGKRPEIPPREELPGPDTAQVGAAPVLLLKSCRVVQACCMVRLQSSRLADPHTAGRLTWPRLASHPPLRPCCSLAAWTLTSPLCSAAGLPTRLSGPTLARLCGSSGA